MQPASSRIAFFAAARGLLAAILLAAAPGGPPALGQTPAPKAPAPQQAPPLPAPAPQAPAPQVPAPQAPPAVDPSAGAGTQAPAAAGTPAAEPAPVIVPPELMQRAARVAADIERLEKAVERVAGSEEQLNGQRGEVQDLQVEAQQVGELLRPRLTAVQALIQRLGPPPGTGAPPEAAGIAAERRRLDEAARQIDGAIKTMGLVQARAANLTARISDLRHGLIRQGLLQRSVNPLGPDLWEQVRGDVGPALRQLGIIGETWIGQLRASDAVVAPIAILATLTYVTLVAIRQRFKRRFLPEPVDPLPDFFLRVRRTALAAAVYAMPLLGLIGVLSAGFTLAGLVNRQVAPFLQALVAALLIYALVAALASALLAPRAPSWRLIALSTRTARRLSWIAGAIAAVFAIDLALDGFIRALFLSPAAAVAQTFLANIALAGLLVLLAGTLRGESRVGPEAQAAVPGGEPARTAGWARRIQLALSILAGLLAFAVAVPSLLGYVNLGRFLASQVVTIACGGIALLLVHLAIRASFEVPDADGRGMGRLLESRLGLDQMRQRQFARLVSWTLSTLLIAFAVPLVMLTWGFTSAEILSGVRALLFGFEVGQFRISLARIIIAGALFVGVLFATRLLQRWLGSTVLSPQRMDAGIANSLHTGLGYLGAALAVLVAISYAGFDITNLAIVAGALSVGIGFGLQSIVNNFVSGLILLIERPIKVGDWIVVEGNQGYVRRISVRSTEIETFDRASLIIPNSQLITGTVQNWTLRNAIGRLLIRIGVAYDSDPAVVREVLLQAVESCPSLLKQPPPKVVFSDFGASSLDFTIYVFVSDITKGLDAQTEVRTAIFNALKAAGIEIPFPQTDVHLRDLDLVKAAMARAADQRNARSEGRE